MFDHEGKSGRDDTSTFSGGDSCLYASWDSGTNVTLICFFRFFCPKWSDDDLLISKKSDFLVKGP